VTFTSTSNDPDGNIVNWTWNFDDGTPLSFKPNPQHTYANGKIYNVTLTVKDNESASNSITKKINVMNNPPVADFVYALVGDSKHVRFDASNSSDVNGTIVSYFWEFGDGKNSTDVIVGHDYERDYTTYKVNLTVTDSAGLTNTISKNVIIGDVTSPTIKITKPVKKTIYINDKIKRQRLLGMSIIIGDITIEVDAKDNNGSGIAKVDFYINGKPKGNDTTAPYNYTWTKDRLRFFHLFTIKVVAYDKAGNKAESKMIVRKIL
jgi:PKD repeat protein